MPVSETRSVNLGNAACSRSLRVRSGSRDLLFLLLRSLRTTYRLVCMLNAARSQEPNVTIRDVDSIALERAIHSFISLGTSRFHSWYLFALDDAALTSRSVSIRVSRGTEWEVRMPNCAVHHIFNKRPEQKLSAAVRMQIAKCLHTGVRCSADVAGGLL